jgi:hypothetical protein
MQSKADAYASKGIFASTTCEDRAGIEHYFYDRLAQKGVVSVASRADVRYENHYQRFAPYEWGYAPSLDRFEDSLGQLACRQKDGPPRYTPANPLWPQRVFGLVTTTYTNAPSPDVSELKAQLSACGIVLKDDLQVIDNGQSASDQQMIQSVTAAENTLQRDQVTTVICVCHTIEAQQLQRQSTATGYNPEWLFSSYMYLDQEYNELQLSSDSQMAHTIGVSGWNKYVDHASTPWYQAIREIEPTFDFNAHVYSDVGIPILYQSMLALASGIQMAGPVLTPSTFQQGLFRTHFPNPKSPISEGTAGFNTRGAGDHTMVKDVALWWWANNTRGTYPGSSSAFCYLNRGERVVFDQLPTDPAYYNFQKPPCDP